ncbi:MAG: hypothetical protein ABIO92_11075 [Chloroflexia bacterium]
MPKLLLLLAIAGLATLMSVTTTTSSAQGIRVQVTDVKAVQVIEDVPLVAGKATAVKVNLTASARTQATIEVKLGASVKSRVVTLAKGANTIYIPVDPPSGSGNLEVTARAIRPSGNQVAKRANVVSLQRNFMKVLFLPVDWTDQDRAKHFSAQYNTFVAASSNFFKASYPLPEQNIQIGSTQSTHMLTADQRAIADAQGNFNWPAITDMYSSIAAAGHRIMPDADLVVGVLPPKWYARNLNEPNVIGLELHAVRSIVSSQVDAGSSTLAHETGHVFGLVDDYNFDINPPKIGNRINVPGYWLANSLQIGTGGKPVYYSFMGAEDAGSRYWVDRDTYMAILQRLQSGTGP